MVTAISLPRSTREHERDRQQVHAVIEILGGFELRDKARKRRRVYSLCIGIRNETVDIVVFPVQFHGQGIFALLYRYNVES